MRQIILITGIIFLFGKMAVSQTEPKTCKDCHSGILEKKVVHAVAAEACDGCHSSNGIEHPKQGVKGFDLAEQLPALCYMCHEEKKQATIHAPVEAGECLTCHSPHASDTKGLLVNDKQQDLCFTCHDAGILARQVKHKPVADGKCSDCHDPHTSDFQKLTKADKPQLCFNCHVSVQMQTKNKVQHPPFGEDCATCHEIHSADVQNLLTQAMPGLCYNCHDMQSAAESAKVVHKVVNDAKGCANCHSPHASNQERLLTKAGKEICLDCHSRTIRSVDRTLANIGQMLKKGNTVHGVIENDGCTVCHNPHYSANGKLLTAAFPEGVYVSGKPETFELCFTCHDQELLTAETTTATGFRNGERNLHFLHISGPKARNCTVCHNVHGSAGLHLIGDKVKFGNWDMPVQYKAEENGGSCNTGCHAEKKYLR